MVHIIFTILILNTYLYDINLNLVFGFGIPTVYHQSVWLCLSVCLSVYLNTVFSFPVCETQMQ